MGEIVIIIDYRDGASETVRMQRKEYGYIIRQRASDIRDVSDTDGNQWTKAQDSRGEMWHAPPK